MSHETETIKSIHFTAIALILFVMGLTQLFAPKWEATSPQEACKDHYGVNYMAQEFGLIQCNDGATFGLIRHISD